MATPADLPYLLKLLEDDSAVVQTAVAKALRALGTRLEPELADLSPPPTAEQRRRMDQVLRKYSREWLRDVWPTWTQHTTTHEQLECAFGLVADFQRGYPHPGKLPGLLDGLASGCRRAELHTDSLKLAHFLFEQCGLIGAQSDYYNPCNSDLVYVIELKRGIPISLTCVYMLLAQRLGLQVEGCGFPGHFLGRVVIDNQVLLVDCYNGGTVLSEEAVINMSPETHRATKEIIRSPVSAETIMARVLRNLHEAYQRAGNEPDARLMQELSQRA